MHELIREEGKSRLNSHNDLEKPKISKMEEEEKEEEREVEETSRIIFQANLVNS